MMDPSKYLSKKTGIAIEIKNDKGEKIKIPLSIDTIELGISKSKFETFSNYFLNSAEFLAEQCLKTKNLGFEFGNVPAYLYLHALELKLKAKLFSIDNEGKSGTINRFF